MIKIHSLHDLIRNLCTVGSGLLDVLVDAGFAPSKSEARRLVEQGGITVDGVSIYKKLIELVWTRLFGVEPNRFPFAFAELRPIFFRDERHRKGIRFFAEFLSNQIDSTLQSFL